MTGEVAVASITSASEEAVATDGDSRSDGGVQPESSLSEGR